MCLYNKHGQRELSQVLSLIQENSFDLQSRENVRIMSKTSVSYHVASFVRCSVRNKHEVKFMDISKESEHNRKYNRALYPLIQYLQLTVA
jgi:hypothetical protein